MWEYRERLAAEGGRCDGEQRGITSQRGQQDIETMRDDSELDPTTRDDSELHRSRLSTSQEAKIHLAVFIFTV
jgi:hypothetical protein